MTLRSGTVEGVYQEIQGALTTCNLIRPGRKFDRAVKALPQRYTVRVLKKDLN